MASKTANPKDKLTALKSKSARKPKASTKDRKPWPLSEKDAISVGKLCELAYLQGETNPLVTQHKKSVQGVLFNIWTQKMWDEKAVPENPDFIIKKKDEDGNPTEMDDMKCQLQVKFQSNGLQKVLPDSAELKEGETVHEKLIEALTSPAVGLTEENAKRFSNEEVTIDDDVILARPLNEMLSENDDSEESKMWHSIGQKLVDYISAEAKGKTGKVTMPEFTEKERSEILVTQQIVRLKDGLFERICSYCENIEQLRKLMLFIRTTIQVSNFDFGMSDEDSVRVERLKGVVQTYLLPEQKKN